MSRIIKRLYEDNVNGKISDERFMELSADYEPVSYTHLDVYKRQAPMIAGGITPRQTKFETNKEKLRQTIRKALATAASFDEFSSLLLREGVSVKESRGRLSYLTPDRTKPITARKLGDDFDRDVYKRQAIHYSMSI